MKKTDGDDESSDENLTEKQVRNEKGSIWKRTNYANADEVC